MSLSQNRAVIDSIASLAEQSKGPDRFDRYFDLCFEYIALKEYQNALRYTYNAEQAANEIGDSLRIVKSRRVRGQILGRLDLQEDAIAEYQAVLKIAGRNNFEREKYLTLNALGVAFTWQSNYDEALACYFQILEMVERGSSEAELFSTLNNIGLVYFKLKDYPKALDYYFRAFENKKNESPFVPRLQINIGLCYNQLKQYENARQYISDGLKACSENCDSETLIGAKFGLGVSYYGQQKLDEALIYFSESLALSRQSSDKRFQLENLVYIARIYTTQQQYVQAEQALTQAEQLAIGTSYNLLLIEIYKCYSDLFNVTNDFQRAANYQQRYIHLKDSVYSEDLIQNISKVQTRFEERENLRAIQSRDVELQRQRSLNFAIGVIAVLAALLIFVLIRSNIVKRRVNRALSDAKGIIEDQNRQLLNSNYHLDQELKEKNTELQKANESLLRVNDELDNFIYKTSHDIRGPLASLKGMCNVALMDVTDPIALDYLKKLDITAEKLNTILTRLLIVNQINSSAIAQDPVEMTTIVNEVLALEHKKGLPPEITINKQVEDGIVIHSDREFIRIILENLIDNAIKFYNNSGRVQPFVSILVYRESQDVVIKVIDNGIGISKVHPEKIFQMFSRASERSETGGIGLYITKTATEKLGGTIHLGTTPEGHTEFFVKIPHSDAPVFA